MAITIVEQPYEFTPLRQPLIVRATSDNTGNTGFQYKVEISVDNVSKYTGYHPANPVNALVLDIRPIIEEFVYLTSASLMANGKSIHSMYTSSTIYAEETTGSREIDVDISEAWIVGGVLTDDPDNDGSQPADIKCVFPGSYQYEDGYRPDPSNDYALFTDTQNVLTDRNVDTHYWDKAGTKGFTKAELLFIPVFESDYGVISAPIAAQADFTSNDVDICRVTIHKADGTSSYYDKMITNVADIAHFGVYPANLNDSTVAGLSTIKPSANPDWVAVSVVFRSNVIGETSLTYVLYNADLYGQFDCRFDRVRLGWTNSRGGWDYFNFIKKSEESVSVERRRYKAIAGNYGTADGDTAFNYSSYDRGLTESKPKVMRMLDINSDWISEGEFALLKWLVVSNNVHWIQDDGSVIPVVIENNDYVMRKKASSKVFNVNFRLRLAHDLNV